MENRRLKRIESHYRQEISALLIRDINDPLLSSITITRVRISPDLKLARVYYYLDGDVERRQEVQKGFRRCRGFLKRELAVRVNLKYTPHLDFFYDETEERERSLDQIFNQLHQEDEKKAQKI